MFSRSKRETTPFPLNVASKQTSNSEAIGDYTQIKLGDRVRDRITGKIGTATERHFHLNGCVYIAVDSPDGGESIADNVQRFELLQRRPDFHRADETMDNAHVKLGDEVKDTMSGFKGHAVAWAVTLFGSHRVGIDPGVKKDGTLGELTFFDECRIELVASKKPPQVKQAKRPAAKERGALPSSVRRQTMRRDTLAR